MTAYFDFYFFIKTDQSAALISITLHEIDENIINITLAIAQFAIFMLFTVKNKSTRKMLKKRGPRIDPRDTPKTISIHVLYELSILVL